MANNWTLGRTGLVYVGEESAYGTAPVLGSTNAVRHQNINLPFNPRNKVASPARYTDPSLRVRYTRRQTGSFDLTALLYPSGTLGTAPECALLLKHGLGTETIKTGSTTVSASPAPTTTGCTVASAANLAINNFIQITIAAGAYAGTYIRFLTGINSAALSWAPALPAAPATSDTVKGCVTYSLATALSKSLDITHYADNQNREQLGCVVDKIVLTLDAAGEPKIQITGPAQGYAASAQSKPAAFTTVGSDGSIPSGIMGGLQVNDVVLEFIKATFEITNGMALQDTAFGTSKPVTYYRKSRRQVAVSIDTMVSSQLDLYTAALATTQMAKFAQCGTAAGYIIGAYAPIVEWEVPDTPDAEETNQFAFKGTALSGSAGNGELYLGFA